jgi:tetratricopeptide (TPR) repeat protein
MLLGVVAAGLALAASEGVDWTSKGLQLYREGHYAEAESMYRRALDAFDRAGEGGSLDRALTLENVAVMLRAQGRYTESEKVQRDALPRLEELTGPNSLATVRAVENLAALYWSSGKLEQAESLALRAETGFRNLPAATQGDRSANRQVLASIYLTQHRYADAENLLHDMLENGDAANSVMTYSNLAAAALGVHDNAKAEEYSRQAIEAALNGLPARHPLLAVSLNNLAQACRFEGKYLEAESYYRQAIGIWEDALGPRHPDMARGMMNLAGFYHERGREAGAEDLYTRAAGILEQSLGRQNADALVARDELSDVLRAERRYTEAEKLSRATLGAMQSAFPTGDPRLERAQANYVRLIEETNRLAQGKKVKVQTLR